MNDLALAQIARDTSKALTVTNFLFDTYFNSPEPDLLAIRHEWSDLFNYLEIISDYLRSASAVAQQTPS